MKKVKQYLTAIAKSCVKVQVKGEAQADEHTIMWYAYRVNWYNPLSLLFCSVWLIFSTWTTVIGTFISFFQSHGKYTIKIDELLDMNDNQSRKRVMKIMKDNLVNQKENLIIKSDKNVRKEDN